jgi:hypothetical protein
MLQRMVLTVLVPLTLALGGCAHPLTLNPNLDAIADGGAAKIDKKVGLVVIEADRQHEVTTPGGGGDEVRYFPYRDLETGIYVALSRVFREVVRVTGVADPKVQSDGLSYVITPRLQTSSSSDSLMTWPPTRFTVELTCQVNNSRGAQVTVVRVVGDGHASFDEFKHDVSLSANRAAEDALTKLVKALDASPALR